MRAFVDGETRDCPLHQSSWSPLWPWRLVLLDPIPSFRPLRPRRNNRRHPLPQTQNYPPLRRPPSKRYSTHGWPLKSRSTRTRTSRQLHFAPTWSRARPQPISFQSWPSTTPTPHFSLRGFSFSNSRCNCSTVRLLTTSDILRSLHLRQPRQPLRSALR